mmetsp:Transcript_46599/g.72938  ORF Transcript_46599/g.72938 Transcript_46599/m.72938 type:complete len:121 (-) Transcript_46599:229-591(-)
MMIVGAQPMAGKPPQDIAAIPKVQRLLLTVTRTEEVLVEDPMIGLVIPRVAVDTIEQQVGTIAEVQHQVTPEPVGQCAHTTAGQVGTTVAAHTELINYPIGQIFMSEHLRTQSVCFQRVG